MATAVAPRVFKNFINGEWKDSYSGKAYENRNPANTDELIGMFVSSTSKDVDAAVDAAKEAYKKWRLVPAPKRAEILFRAAELLLERKEQYSKHDLLHGGRGAAAVRPNDSLGAAQ
jgi:acyl-CoA reductase-like NAD-dependent aldehyde dehydrogenase